MPIDTERKGRPTSKLPADLREEGYKLYCKGVTHQEISALLDVSRHTVASWVKRHKWAERYRAEKAGVQSSLVPRSDSVTTQASTLPTNQAAYEGEMQAEALRLPALMRAMDGETWIKNADKIAKLDAVARKALKLEGDKPTVVVNVGLLAGTQAKRLHSGQSLTTATTATLVEHTGNEPALPNHEPVVLEAQLVE